MIAVSIAIGWLLLVLIGVPIGISLILVSMGYFYVMDASSLFAVQRMIAGLNSFPLLAVPLFILTGNLLNSTGITERLFGFANKLVGHMTGGLGHVNILASVFFSGMSGSAMADAGGLGKLEIKAMSDAGYDLEFSGAVTAASSMIGPLIPPSITMVLYGVVTQTSVGALFLGGVIPGLLCALSLMIMVYYFAKKRHYPISKKATCREVMQSGKESIAALLTPFIIIGGIFSGYFSPTEAAAITVLYACILGFFVYKDLTLKKLWEAIYETAVTSASIGTIIAGVSLFGYILAIEQAPQHIAMLFLHMTNNPLLFLFIVNVLLFILGAFIESMAIMMMLVPMMAPVAMQYGIDPIHFGIIVVLNLMISILTPPMGVSLFIVAKVGNIPYENLARAILPWLIPPLTVLLLITLFPSLVTFLPHLLMSTHR